MPHRRGKANQGASAASQVRYPHGGAGLAGGSQQEAELLASCYRESLLLAAGNELHSIASCSISTGVYGYPKAAACQIALDTTLAFLRTASQPFHVYFVCFDLADYALYEAAVGALA